MEVDIMQKIEVEVKMILEVIVKADSWAGHKEAEDKTLKTLDNIFKEAVDNFTVNDIVVDSVEVEGTQEN
jgi:hypothetical protein